MADRYWNEHPPPPSMVPAGAGFKRPRPEYDFQPAAAPSGHEMHNYMPRDDDRGVARPVKDTKAIDSAYDRYLQNAKLSGEAATFGAPPLGRPGGSGMPGLPRPDAVMGRGGPVGPDWVPNGQNPGLLGQPPMDAMGRPGAPTLPLPPDASNTLYVEGLPPNCTRREVAHIFRPFVGYKEVRLVTKDSKVRGGDPLILCFVDFEDPACAATAMSALQGYKMDENDPDSKFLRLQFSRNPGPRSGPRIRGRR